MVVSLGQVTETSDVAVAEEEFNLARVFDTLAEVLGDRECVVWRDRRVTYAQLAERSRRLANYLLARGLGTTTDRSALAGHESGQDHLALALHNGPEYFEGMLGGYLSRVAPFNVNYRYVGHELRYLLADGKPRAIVFHAALAPVLAEVLDDIGGIDVRLQVADDSGNDLLEGAVDYETALASVSADPPLAEPSPDDLFVLYTGGTTGMPKCVLWRQHDIFMNAMGGRRTGNWEELHNYRELAAKAAGGSGLKLLLLPPLMHGAAQWASFQMMTDGATILLPDDTTHVEPADVWRTVEREGAQIMTIVGDATLRPLLDELDRGTYDISSLFAVGNGGAAFTAALRERARQHIPNLYITDAAGSSETGYQMQSASSSDDGVLRFTPGPGTVVVSEQFDSLLEPGHEGNGWLAQTGWIPLGYLGDADKTARTFPTIDGVRYAIPGDRARYLADGRVELLGRDAVTINSGGEKIFAEEVEAAIAGHEAVVDVVVAGRPSERWGNEVVAVVQLADGQSVSEEEINDFASRSIARYKLPKEVVFVDRVQRSPSGKADYRWAKEQAIEGARPRPS